MRVLAACEESQTVAEAFRVLGHDARSCDTLPSKNCDGGCPLEGECALHGHYRGDVMDLLIPDAWDLMIAFPPCTYLCSSGLHWNVRVPGRARKTEDALVFVRALVAAPIPLVALENPVGRIGTAIRPADQTIQPWMFGHDASKATCLWLKGLPLLRPTKTVPPRLVGGKKRWGNQTDSGQNRLGPSLTRARERSRTYRGIAEAMAAQWGGVE